MTYPFCDKVPGLLQIHYEHLKDSAIADEVIVERGYKSVLGKKALVDAGFSKSQQRSPGILIPIHGVDGSVVGYQYRPDRPRISDKDKVIKYENPAGSTTRLDVSPRCRPQLGNPQVPIWFTEGVKKVDSLASQDACAVGLTGVWGFKGKNIMGGTTILADFDLITLKDRDAYLVFDSDLSTNPKVHQALNRLAEHLTRKGTITHLIFLPPGPGGEKTGVDDYLAQGHILNELISLQRSEEEAPIPPKIKKASTQYDIIDGIICWLKPTTDGISEVPLCNFNARVTEDILRDNGLEMNRFFKIEGQLPGKRSLPIIETSAAGFYNLNWVTSEWGMKAIIAAGQTSKDRLREAIQLQSRDAHQRTLYTHTGWREIDGEMYFLSGAGAMGREDIEVELEPSLQRYQLLKPAGDPLDAIKKSFDFCLVAEPEVSLPLWSAMYLAPLTEFIDTAFTLWLVGASGSFKSTLTALALCHFGDFDTRHLPAAWRDSQNTLERLLFTCKDLPLVIDDWAPGQDSSKGRELEVKAEYVVRAQGNRQGRQRMRSDTTIRAGYVPRGLLITSGEQLPSGHSHTARIYSLDIEKTDIYLPFLCSAQEERFFYCVSMSHYVAWLKSQWKSLKETLPKRWREYRDKTEKEQSHPRLPEVIASLTCAVDIAAEYALEYKAIKSHEADSFKNTGWDIFRRLAAKQSGRIEEERPAARALELWRAMIDTGKAVLWSKDDDAPRVPVPGQTVIGWLDNSNDAGSAILLDPRAAHGALVEYGGRTGQPFTIKQDALWRDMKRQNLIEHTNGHYTIQSRIYGNVKRVVKLKNYRLLYEKSGDSGDSGDF